MSLPLLILKKVAQNVFVFLYSSVLGLLVNQGICEQKQILYTLHTNNIKCNVHLHKLWFCIIPFGPFAGIRMVTF